MFEYINPGFYLLSGIMVFMALLLIVLINGKEAHEDKKLSFPFFPLLLIVFAVGIPIHDGISVKDTIQSNTKSFRDGALLQCYTFGTSYLVSQEQGWNIYEDGFTKNSLIIRGDKCENK